jgi:hypothetical protein
MEGDVSHEEIREYAEEACHGLLGVGFDEALQLLDAGEVPDELLADQLQTWRWLLEEQTTAAA